jgi:16S rRNA (adenine1518-N6/adenine1519-N6)-dimethyltransferase
LLERVTEAAFGQRRKMLRQSLRSLGGDVGRLLESTGLDPTARAEDIPVAGFVALAQALAAQRAVKRDTLPTDTGDLTPT